MSRLKSRLDKLDGGFDPDDGFVQEYRPIEDRPEWPDEVGDFIWSRMGVFYRQEGESVAAFVERVNQANWPVRRIQELSDEELLNSLASVEELMEKMKPEYRAEYEMEKQRLSEAEGASS